MAACLVGLTGLVGCDLGEPPAVYQVEGSLREVHDVNGDGYLDLVVMSATQVHVLAGDGAGGFSSPTSHDLDEDCIDDPSDPVDRGPGSCGGVSIRLRDVDADGDVDLLTSYSLKDAGIPVTDRWRTLVDLRLNDGTGAFGAPGSTVGPWGVPGYGAPSVSYGDVTADGWVDMLFVGNPILPVRQMYVMPGDGTGGFGPAVVSDSPVRNVSGPRVVDLNEDGNADLAFVGSCATTPSGPYDEEYLRGCVDIALGDGSGAFAGWSRHVAADSRVDQLGAGAFGDVDGDGNLDIVAGNTGRSFDGGGPVASLSVFSGDGAGGFGPEVSQPATEGTERVAIADVDADGHVDLLTGINTGGGHTGRILFGDGAGAFAGNALLGHGLGEVADLDADGRPDYVQSSGGTTTEVFLNRWDGRP